MVTKAHLTDRNTRFLDCTFTVNVIQMKINMMVKMSELLEN